MNKHTTNETTNEIPYGYCQCGCGQKTKLAQRTSPTRRTAKDQPVRFVRGHHGRRSLLDRFWEKVNVCEPNECWSWTGSTNLGGYGEVRDGKTLLMAHRFSYEIHHGPIPEGMEMCHSCDNPSCCNPAHLFVGTRSDNMLDMYRKGRANREWHGVLGEQNHRSKLTAEQVREIRRLCAGGTMQKDVAKTFGVHKGTVGSIVRRENWTHIE